MAWLNPTVLNLVFLLNLRRAEEVSNVIIIDNLWFLLINGGQRLTAVVLKREKADVVFLPRQLIVCLIYKS